ncbi:MAG: IS21-like element helper ATPase IstB [Coprobacillus cateniformis]|uniref:IS21-like element helper ATPase IstB n=1 Tax=Longibaculum muris TaxID=1796628 RepID=UPI003AB181D7|nr:IS21-like element helper ATPase IstB [Coprobacillus cateniformis]
MNDENISKLKALRLPGMVAEYERQCTLEDIDTYTFDQRMSLMIDAEFDSEHNNKIKRLIKNANFSESSASLTQIKYYPDRHLDKALITELSTNSYIKKNRNIIITGASGSGKSYVANSLGVNACHNGLKVNYVRLPDLLHEFELSRLQKTYYQLIKKYQKCDLLIIDEWLLIPTTDNEQRDLLELIERRYRSGSTILCSQFSTEVWHKKLGGGAIADAIMDRIINNSTTIFIDGKVSMRSQERE